MGLQEKIDSIIRTERNKRFASSAQITLGELIDKIDNNYKMADGTLKTIRFDFGTAIPTHVSSWRGSYCELAIGYRLSGYDESSTESAKAKDVLDNLKSAIGKTFDGWKGGEYLMSRDTPIWVDNPGNSSETAVVGLLDNVYEMIILTAYCEY